MRTESFSFFLPPSLSLSLSFFYFIPCFFLFPIFFVCLLGFCFENDFYDVISRGMFVCRAETEIPLSLSLSLEKGSGIGQRCTCKGYTIRKYVTHIGGEEHENVTNGWLISMMPDAIYGRLRRGLIRERLTAYFTVSLKRSDVWTLCNYLIEFPLFSHCLIGFGPQSI